MFNSKIVELLIRDNKVLNDRLSFYERDIKSEIKSLHQTIQMLHEQNRGFQKVIDKLLAFGISKNSYEFNQTVAQSNSLLNTIEDVPALTPEQKKEKEEALAELKGIMGTVLNG